MTEILTPEQVVILCFWTGPETEGKKRLIQLCESHEALRQLAVANQQDATTERQMADAYIYDLKTDLRALGEALQEIAEQEGTYNSDPERHLQDIVNACIQIAEEALTRPGVRAVMGVKHGSDS